MTISLSIENAKLIKVDGFKDIETFLIWNILRPMKLLAKKFYEQKNVLEVARQLLGKIVVSQIDGINTSGRVVEAEAYIGLIDRASHSFNGRRTQKNEHMYAAPGTVYVYVCYGMHQMLNVVTNEVEIPDAVLIRAIEPIGGIEAMCSRTGKALSDSTLTMGPGNVCKALGISKVHSGQSFLNGCVTLWDDGYVPEEDHVGISGRIGVEGAGAEAAGMPYRFYIRRNKYVSGSPRT